MLCTTTCAFSLFNIFWNSDYRQRFPLNILKLRLSPKIPTEIHWNLKTQKTPILRIEVSCKPPPIHPWCVGLFWNDISFEMTRCVGLFWNDISFEMTWCIGLFWNDTCARGDGWSRIKGDLFGHAGLICRSRGLTFHVYRSLFVCMGLFWHVLVSFDMVPAHKERDDWTRGLIYRSLFKHVGLFSYVCASFQLYRSLLPWYLHTWRGMIRNS